MQTRICKSCCYTRKPKEHKKGENNFISLFQYIQVKNFNQCQLPQQKRRIEEFCLMGSGGRVKSSSRVTHRCDRQATSSLFKKIKLLCQINSNLREWVDLLHYCYFRRYKLAITSPYVSPP
ncbi:uncharacterized protein LOC130655017 [Hydractinia symbiolongicarpus]|uniref:uncharacterized protein LOC130655017 n=1 Tax=Hydractinia symbiolongicarpus TaxID=13093 RepID=UPI00254E32B2|nr:uncharacterized protein LOC130655017 [Hydractinia symbiolongicarpus]